MTKFTVTDRAKQGDANAIASLLNHSLQSKGIQVLQASCQAGRLQILLATDSTSQPQGLVNFIHRGLDRLDIATIDTVRIVGCKTGDRKPLWSEQFTIEHPTTASPTTTTVPSSLNLKELAQQGNSDAIASLLNIALKLKQITAKASLQDRCLQVILEGQNVPDAEACTRLIRRQLSSVLPKTVTTIKLYGKTTGAEFPDWNEEFSLHPTPPSKTVSSSQSSKISNNLILQKIRNIDLSFLKNLASQKYGLGAVSGLSFLLITASLLFGIWKLTADTPQKTVDRFLQLLSEGDEDAALELFCSSSGSVLFAVEEWKPVGKQEKASVKIYNSDLVNAFPELESNFRELDDRKYSEITFRIDSSTKGGMPIKKDWTFTVWKRKDNYKFSEGINTLDDTIGEKTRNLPGNDYEALSQQLDLMQTRLEWATTWLSHTGDPEYKASSRYCITDLEER